MTAQQVVSFIRQEDDGLLARLEPIVEQAKPGEREFWNEELETLRRFSRSGFESGRGAASLTGPMSAPLDSGSFDNRLLLT